MGVCTNVVVGYNNFTVASGDYGKIPAPASSLTIVSVFVQLTARYESIVEPVGKVKLLYS